MLKPCVCGKLNRSSFYLNNIYSPNDTEVKIGVVVLLLVTLVMVFVALVLPPFWAGVVLLMIPIIPILMFLSRLAKGHKPGCSFRWTGIALASIGKYASF